MVGPHVKLATLMAVIGFVFTSRPWLNFLNKLGPEKGLVLKNVIVVALIFTAHAIDRSVALPHWRALGVFLMYIAFMMIFNYQSDWIEESGSDNVGDQTVDGAVYHRARTTLNLGPEMSRMVTFVVVPFVLAFFSSKIIRNGQKMNLN